MMEPARERPNWVRTSPRVDDEEHTSLAVVHTADGRVLRDCAPRFRAITQLVTPGAGPCTMVSVSTHSVFVSPALKNQFMGTDLLRSRDAGRSFELLSTPRPVRHAPVGFKAVIWNLLPSGMRRLARSFPDGVSFHPYLYRDPASGRLFSSLTIKGAHADGSGSVVAFSDDDGDNWCAVPVGQGSWDWGKLFSGPPASAQTKRELARSGYPSVLYFCATGPTLIVGPNQLTYRSTDGGESWERVGNAFSRLAARSLQTGYPQGGVVDSRGTLHRAWAGTSLHFIPLLDKSEICINVLSSCDEGETWHNRELSHTRSSLLEPTLAIDCDDTLYLAWTDRPSGRICLSFSRDHAQSWSTPRTLQCPDVRWASKVTIAVRDPGDIALSYWGSAQFDARGDGWVVPDGRPYYGYITRCEALFDAYPVFHTMRTSLTPLLPHGESALRSGEYLGPPSFGADGSAWASFVDLRGSGGTLVVHTARLA